MNRLSDLTGARLSESKPVPSNRYYPLTNQCVGVELEFSKGVGDYIPGWETKRDGSIKDEDGATDRTGVECIFDGASTGKQINERLGSMQKMLDNNPRFYIPNATCATHVHIDMTDFPMDRMERLMEVVLITEPYLFHWAGQDRMDNIFCVPWSYSMGPHLMVEAERHMANGDFRRAQRTRGVSKYSCVNPMTMAYMGTLEFRHLPSTRDMKRVKKWIGMCMHIKRLAMFDDTDILQELSSNEEEFSKFLFGNLAGEFSDYPIGEIYRNVNLINALRGCRQEEVVLPPPQPLEKTIQQLREELLVEVPGLPMQGDE